MENNKTIYNNNFYIKKIFLAAVLEIVVFVIIMLFVFGILQLISEFCVINDMIYNTVMYISSTIIGIISIIFIIKLLFKDNCEINIKKVIVGMVFVQILVFILLFISAQDVIDKTIILLKEDENLKDIFYDEYAIGSLLFGLNYDDWKANYIKEIEASRDVWQKYSLITISLHTFGTLLGIVISSIRTKKYKKI